ncbi:MAG TPA: ATP synthase F1 subunit gamma [Ruminiclostridium sp.]|nr:ATP synthase F1 subunit gamma [Ruminiclostridium sp.]
MANIREIKLRIKSVTETRQITKAMKLISAAKRKKARQQLDRTLPYFSSVKATVADILSRDRDIAGKYFDKREEKQVKTAGVFVLTGDKSLTGGYNHNIIRHTEQLCQRSGDTVLFVAGQTGRSYFSKKTVRMDDSFDYQVSDPTLERAGEITDIMLDGFLSGELDEVYINYTQMINTFSLVPRTIKLLPLELDALKKDLEITPSEKAGSGVQIYYEPSPDAVLDILVPKYLKGIIYGALVESFTSEQSARMTAMDSATTNADKMISTLNLRYNRARQAAITQEITEIVGGASALE